MVNVKMGPGPRFEPESWDPQSQRITTYPTPANEFDWWINAGAGIRTLVGLRQQVLSLSPLASSGTPASMSLDITVKINFDFKFFINIRKMLRPGFEPESSARKAEMIGRTTLPEHVIYFILKWAQWDSNPWPLGYEPSALPG